MLDICIRHKNEKYVLTRQSNEGRGSGRTDVLYTSTTI